MQIRDYLREKRRGLNPLLAVAVFGISIGIAGVVANYFINYLRAPFSSQKTELQTAKAAVMNFKRDAGRENKNLSTSSKVSKSDEAEADFKQLKVEIKSSLPHSFYRVVGKEKGKLLSALAARLLMWKLDLRRDLRRGDLLKLLYKPVDDQSKFQIEAMSYKSQKLGQTFYFFRFQADGEKYPAYYDERGQKIEKTLKNSPIRTYEQITSFPKMRPRHKGIDFKAPTGTKIYLPYRAKIIRTNWNTRFNGYCIEAEYFRRYREKRVRAIFLHLSEILPAVKKGAVLPAGTPIALSGNTGRSTAPHLHYQLQTVDKKVIFPFKFHGSFSTRLDDSSLDKFQKRRETLKELLEQL